MLESFTSYIELFAALYLTISLDDILFGKFWMPDYKKKARKQLKGIGLPPLAEKTTISNTVELAKIEDMLSRRRGALMLGLCIILLVIAGFEGLYLPVAGSVFCSFSLLLLMAIIGISYVFDGVFLKCWRHVCIMLIVGALFYSLVLFVAARNSGHLCLYGMDCFWLSTVTKSLVILMLLLPILWQLFRNWMYSTYYLEYVSSEAKKSLKEYEVKTREVDYSEDDVYIDHDVSEPFEKMMEDLKPLFVPRIPVLIKYAFREYRSSSGCRIRRAYRRYVKMRPRPLISDYCEKFGIDRIAFCVYKKKKTIETRRSRTKCFFTY